ncbi:MAG: glycosyltransferase, partial [Casimicrobiaceae bacterium]
RTLQQTWNDRHPVSVSDIISAAMCIKNTALVELYGLLASDADVVVLEHPYLAPLLQTFAPPRHVIYEAFNVESALKAAVLDPHPDRDALVRQVRAIENKACADAECIVCVSDEDRDAFEASGHRKVVVIRNGVDTHMDGPDVDLSAVRPFFEGRTVAVFLGSGHMPNIEAVKFIVCEVAPANARVVFLIIGSSAEYFAGRDIPSNVLLCGRVEDDVKNVLLAVADLAVNPMLAGGGSSLKVPEYMAAGLPVITTRIGVRGYDVVDGVHAIVADPAEFAARLAALAGDEERRRLIGANGREYACAGLDWQRLGAHYRDVIDGLTGGDPAAQPEAATPRTAPKGKRLLVVTYRFTDPAQGGAEAFLLATLKGVHALGDFDVDVATFAVQGIADHLQFSAHYEARAQRPDAFEFVRAVHRFAVDPADEAVVNAECAALFELWQREDLRQARMFEEDYEVPTLLGGWFHPERHGERLQRWTGPQAEIFCPRGVSGLTIHGFTDGSRTLTLREPTGRTTGRTTTVKVRGAFVIELNADSTNGGVCALTVEPAGRVGGDPRRLGVCVTAIAARRGAASIDVPLRADFAAWMRQKDLARWVQSLIDITNARDMRDDRRFLAVRGPHSRLLDAWLRDHVEDYDVVLAHGVPFSTSVLGAACARQQAVPCVVLPHFHLDDKYYHWREFYEAFRSADRVIAAPRPAKTLFFDRIGARAVTVAGGGVDPAEFENAASCGRAFRALHPSADPFVLVLGRKSGAKNYATIVAAVEAANRAGTRIDLVMIGPDDDGLPLEGRHVHYLGSQPRAVVLGALAHCHCLANMSESESFGIVVVEAWMCGRPVVANGRNVAFADLIEHGCNGLLCQTVDEVTDALRRVVDEPHEAARLGAAGRAEALASYTWPRIAASINDVLLRVCRNGRSRTGEEADARKPASLPA